MRFLRGNKTEPERPRCAVCHEFLTEGETECQMCGHPVGTAAESERPEPVEPTPPPAPG